MNLSLELVQVWPETRWLNEDGTHVPECPGCVYDRWRARAFQQAVER